MTGLMQLADPATPSRSGVLARSGPLVNRPRIAAEAGLWTALTGGVGLAAGSFLSAVSAPVQPAQTAMFAAGSAVVVASRAWWAWRQQMTQTLQASIWSEVGANRVRLRGGLGLVPSRVVVTYTPAIEGGDRSPSFAAQLADIVSARTGARFRLHRLDLVRCKAVFRRIQPPEEGSEPLLDAQGVVLARATRTANELLRGTAVLSDPRWDDAGRLTRFAVRHQVGTMVATIAQQARIERIMSTMLPGRWRAHWDHEQDTITFTLRSELAASIPHPVTDPGSHPFRLPFGVDEDGNTLYWTLRGQGASPHLLVVGKTGTGKTVCLLGIIAEITRRGWPVWLGDPKRVEFIGLRDWPNVQLVATTVHEQTAMVHRALDVMEYRYACIEAGEADEHSWDPLFVVLDEYRDFFGALRSWYARTKGKGAPSAAPVLEALGSLVRKGRTAGVHFIIGTQRPDSDYFGGETRDNFHARISLGALSPQGAQMMWEAPHVGVAVPMIKGRGTAIGPDEQPVEFQAYWTPDPHPRKLKPGSADEELLRSLRPRRDRWEKLAVLPPSAQEISAAGSEYMAWAAAPLVAVADHPDLAHSRGQAEHLRDQLSAVLRSLGPRGSSPTGLTDEETGPGEQPWDGWGEAADTQPIATVLPFHRPSATRDAAAVDSSEEQSDLDVEDDYQAPEALIVDDLAAEAGALVLVDEATGTWGVVESVEPDPLEGSMVCVSWTDLTSGQSSLLSVPAGEVVTARRTVHSW